MLSKTSFDPQNCYFTGKITWTNLILKKLYFRIFKVYEPLIHALTWY